MNDYYHYQDGISKEISRLSLEELEERIAEEQKKSDAMNEDR